MKLHNTVLAITLSLLYTTASLAAENPAISVNLKTQSGEIKTVTILRGDENGNLNTDKLLKRGEAVQLIVNIMGISKAAESHEGDVTFRDIPKSHFAFKPAYAVRKYGDLLQGRGNNMFEPDENIKYEEYIKLLVYLLGYYPIAEEHGGYPEGYMFAAKQIGLTDDSEHSEFVSRKEAALLAEKTLSVPMMKRVAFAPDRAAKYEIQDGKDGRKLERYFDRFYSE